MNRAHLTKSQGDLPRQTQAHAKLLLFGEHAAVWGHPAVGLSLASTLTLRYEPAQDTPWQCQLPPDLGSPEHQLILRLIEVFQTLRTSRGLPALNPGRLQVESNIPRGGGWGSSAALSSAFARLFLPQAPLEGPESLDEAAREGEKLFHGRPSGIDTALALREGWWFLERVHEQLTPLPLPDRTPALVAGALPRLTTTKALVGGIAERHTRDPEGTSARLTHLGELARRAQQSLQAPNFSPKILGSLFQEAQTVLAELGVSHPALEQVFTAAQAWGSLGGKLSGAGGGGAFVLIFPDTETALAACEQLQKFFPQAFWAAPPQVVQASTRQNPRESL